MRALGIEVDRGGDLMSHVTASDNSRIADSENYRPDHLFNLRSKSDRRWRHLLLRHNGSRHSEK